MPELLTNVLAEHTYDPVCRIKRFPAASLISMTGADIDNRAQMRQQLPKDAPRYLARGLKAIY